MTGRGRLASGKTMTVGLIMPLTGQWFYNKVATDIEAVLMEEGYDAASAATGKAPR